MKPISNCMKKIILATDFSRNAKNAIENGIQLFGIQGVNYIIVNSFVEPKATTNVVVSMNDLLRKESIKGLKVLEHSLQNSFLVSPLIHVPYMVLLLL